jgi:hypothetical protein
MTFRIIIAAVFVGTLLACNSTKITYSWKGEVAGPKKNSKIIVVGLIKDSDFNLREKMENHLVGDLTERGYNAISSLKEYGSKTFQNMTEDEVMNKLTNKGVNAVFTIVLLSKEREQYYIRDGANYLQYSVNRGNFYSYYNIFNDRIFTPGYYATETKYFWESNFFDLQSKQLIYTAKSKSFNPASTELLAHEHGKLVIKNMEAKGVIEKLKL